MFLGLVAIAVFATIAIWNYQQNKKLEQLSDLALANIEALARGEVLKGKICYYKGTSVYGDYYPCTADYPNIGKCGPRVKTYYSKDKGQCYE